MKHPNRKLYGLVLLALGVSLLAAAPAGPTPRALPVAGLNGTGIGYCVTVEDAAGKVLGNVEVPFHVVNPSERSRRGLPPLDPAEFEASVRNATALVVGAESARTSDWVCATTYRDSKGNVLGCGGACGDCVKVRVKRIQ